MWLKKHWIIVSIAVLLIVIFYTQTGANLVNSVNNYLNTNADGTPANSSI
jgi:hypothetical protein